MPDTRSVPADTPAATGDPAERPRVVAVVGPTATGKTRLAEDMAVALDGQVVTADSMQVYRGLDIGTAKTTESERRVPHYCIDLVEPDEPFSAALYQHSARRAIDTIAAAGKLPVVAGGTGLYVRAALDDMHFPSGDATGGVRERLEAQAAEKGAPAMHALLAERDPEAAALIHPNNVRRVIRALEMLEGGESYARLARRFRERAQFYRTSYIGLTLDRELLYARIDARVDEMLDGGLLGEVERLLDAGFREALTAPQAIGYKELVPVLTEGAPLDKAVESIKRATRRYAKRQLTWFRADPRVTWLDITGMSAEDVARTALDLLASDALLRVRREGEDT